MSQSLAARTADEEDVDAQAHLSIGTKLLWDSRAEHRPLDGSPRTPLLSSEWKLKTTETAVADSDRWLWYPLDHSAEVGLAAPVKKLLTRLKPD